MKFFYYEFKDDRSRTWSPMKCAGEPRQYPNGTIRAKTEITEDEFITKSVGDLSRDYGLHTFSGGGAI